LSKLLKRRSGLSNYLVTCAYCQHQRKYMIPELKGLDEYIASFCALGGKSQAQEIVNEHLKTRKKIWEF